MPYVTYAETSALEVSQAGGVAPSLIAGGLLAVGLAPGRGGGEGAAVGRRADRQRSPSIARPAPSWP